VTEGALGRCHLHPPAAPDSKPVVSGMPCGSADGAMVGCNPLEAVAEIVDQRIA